MIKFHEKKKEEHSLYNEQLDNYNTKQHIEYKDLCMANQTLMNKINIKQTGLDLENKLKMKDEINERSKAWKNVWKSLTHPNALWDFHSTVIYNI